MPHSYEIKDDKLIVPGPFGIGTEEVDLAQLRRADERRGEVAFVTPQKAPELMALFTEAYSLLSKVCIACTAEVLHVTRAAQIIRSKILLDKVPAYLKEHGISTARSPLGSEDIRNAILAQDEDYKAAQLAVEEAEMILDTFKGQAKTFEMSFTAVRKALGEGAFNFRNPNLKENPRRYSAPDEQSTQSPSVRFGKANV